MKDVVVRSELLRDLSQEHRDRLLSIAREQTLAAGEYLFRLGDEADSAYVVAEGRIDMCFPLSFGGAMQDVAVESKMPGSALGWSAFVSPHRFTLSARAAEPGMVAAFPRAELSRLMDADCQLGQAFIARIAEIVGGRLLKIQALWARELQRSVSSGGLSGIATRGAPGGANPAPLR